VSADSVGLLDVVPWTHGYVHSWALRWMLEHSEPARDALLTLFVPQGQAPWTLRVVEPEHRVGRHRVDLRVDVTDADGHDTTVLVETKVNDAVSESQLSTYCAERAEVVLYAPGLTGLLLASGDPAYRELWVTGSEVTRVLEGIDLPELLRGYLNEVAMQAARMDAAKAAARGDALDFPRDAGISGVSGDDVEAVAWIAEIAAAMRTRGAEDVRTRNTRHDYGVFWAGSWHAIPGLNGAGAYVDVVAAHGGWEYVITIKVGDGSSDDRVALYDAAMRAGRPWEGWEPGRRSRAENFRVWKLDASTMSASEAADAATRLQRYLDQLAASAA